MSRAVSLSSEVPYSKLRRPDPPVSKLALGILLQALRDVVTPQKSSLEDGEDWRHDAIEWFNESETSPGSLHWVCQILEFNPSGLLHWIEEFERSHESRREEWARKLTRFHIPH